MDPKVETSEVEFEIEPKFNKVAIIGGRNFTDYHFLKTTIQNWEEIHGSFTTVVSGGASGADELGEKYADEFGKEKLIFLTDWKTHGKAAGPIRNTIIIDNSDAVLAFPTPTSRGTWDSVNKVKKKEIPTFIFKQK